MWRDTMMKNKELYFKILFWTLWAVLVTVCVYYIVHNAQWLIGDDAIVIRHTGFGKAFLPSDTVNPGAGRFYPFAYLAYNILLLFGGDHISPMAHYALEAMFFLVFVVSVTMLVLSILEEQKVIWKYSIALLVTIVFVGRVYPLYTECFSTAWCGCSILAVFMLCTFLFYKKQKWIYGFLSLLCINYSCYCGESAFVLPLSFGVCSLLFQRKTMTRKVKAFNWCLVGSSILFLVLYAILVLPYIKSSYDSAHGSEVGVFENAVRMLWAQKLLVLALVLFVIRLVDIIRNKKDYTIYDNLLMSAAACCCGNFVLRLNWTLYYNGPALLVLPSILYFSIYYLKERWTLVLFIALALFYGRKIPTTIQKNQKHRSDVYREITSLSTMIDQTSNVFWYGPSTDEHSYDLILRDWKHHSLDTYLGWLRFEPDFSTTEIENFERIDNSIWLSTIENKQLFPEDSCLLKYGELIFSVDSIQGYRVLIHE